MGSLLNSLILFCVLGAFVTFLAFSIKSYLYEVPELDCPNSSQIEMVILNMIILSAYCSLIALYHTFTMICMGRIFLPRDCETFCARLLTAFLTFVSPLLIMIYFVVLAYQIQSYKVDIDTCGRDGYQLNILETLAPFFYIIGGSIVLFIVYKIARYCGCTCKQDNSDNSSSIGSYNNDHNQNNYNEQLNDQYRQNSQNAARQHQRMMEERQRVQDEYRRQQQQQAEQRFREQQQAEIKRNNRI
eukprot:403334603